MLRRACPRVVLLTDGQLVSQSTFRRIQLEQATAAAFRRSGSLQSEPSPSHQSTAGAQRPREQGSQASGQARAELGKVESQEYTRLLRMLGCRNGATNDDLKAAYYEKAKQLHPDRSGGETVCAHLPQCGRTADSSCTFSSFPQTTDFKPPTHLTM